MQSLVSTVNDTNEVNRLGGGISGSPAQIDAALLTGGQDRNYAFGLATAMVKKDVRIEVIGMIESTVLSSIRPRTWSS